MNLTNDSWGKSLSCQNQHLAMAVFRSLENHIPSVRSASSGMTCFINEYGEIGKYAPPFSESFVFDEIPVLNQDMPLSFYTKTGDVFSFVILIFSITLLLIDCIKGILFLWQK